MRITTKLATAGEKSGYLSMPAMSHPASYYTLGDRGLDEDKVRRELNDHEGIQISNDDDRDTLSFSVELLDRMKTAMARLMERDSEVRPVRKGDKKTTAQRRFDRGMFVFVRVDVRRNGGGGFRVAVSASDPKGVVGNAAEFARIYSQAFADNILAIADSLKKEGVPVVLIEKEGCAGVFARARVRIDHQILCERLEKCPCRHGVQCSPVQRNCELFNKDTGRCRFADKPWEEME